MVGGVRMPEKSFQFRKDAFSFLMAGVVVVFAIYFFWNLQDFRWPLLDNVDLVFHEAGHPIFSTFGEFIGITGGTIMQLGVPLGFVLYFIFTKRLFSAAMVMFWLAQSILNVSVYLADAVETKLPLVGGPIHDWNYLFSRMHLLSKTGLITDITRVIGVLIMVAATVGGLITSFYRVPDPLYDNTKTTGRTL